MNVKVVTTVISLVVIIGFLAFAVPLLVDVAGPNGERAFGALTTIYAAGSAMLLALAWKWPSKTVETVTLFLAGAFLAAWVTVSFDLGRIRGLEAAAAVLVAIAVALNWVAVRVLVTNKQVGDSTVS